MPAYSVPPVSMVMLGVRNIEQSLSFYRDKLGIKMQMKFEGFAFLDTGAVRIILSEALAKNSDNIAGATEVIFAVEDVCSATDSLKQQGVTFSHEPHQVNGPMWAANFPDLDGHLLTLFGPERKAA
jgi:catechol 2,3-dioxygenase-like lactoylglutathione lyase family enzyme